MLLLLVVAACTREPPAASPRAHATGDTGGAPSLVDTAPTGDTGSAATGDTGAPPAPDSVWLDGGLPSAYAGGYVSVRDLDADGAAELAVGGRDAAWVLGGPWVDGAVPALARWTAPASDVVELLPDLTGDGVGDLALASAWGCGGEVHAGPFPPGGVVDAHTLLYAPETGETFTSCGDVDGDGDPDLCVGTDPNCSARGFAPAVQVYALPLPPAALTDEHALVTIPSTGGEDLETGAVDLDGDGRDEIVVAAPEAADGDGTVWLVRDPPAGVFDLAQADATFGGASEGNAGHDLARADLDGDGGEDLVVAAPGFTEGSGYYAPAEGRVWVVTDDAGGPLPAAPIALGGSPDGFLFGEAVAVGDLDGDGAQDLAVSEIVRSAPGPGRVAVHLGPLPAGTHPWGDAALVVDGWGPDDYAGVGLAIGDLDGDGRDDLAIGGTGDRGGLERAGAVHLLFGAAMFP